MGMLDRMLGRQPSASTGTGQYLPAESYGTALKRSGSAALDRAGQFYKQNPKKVQAVGLIAAAALLARLSQGRR